MLNINERFCRETFDEKGKLLTFDPVVPENFNFAYDVVDEIAKVEQIAALWFGAMLKEKNEFLPSGTFSV